MFARSIENFTRLEFSPSFPTQPSSPSNSFVLVQYSAIPMMLAGAIISPLHLSDTDTQREFRVAKRIKLLLQNLPQFRKQSEVWSCWNDNALVQKHTDYRIIPVLKHTVTSRKTPEWEEIADLWRPQQNAGIYGATYLPGLTALFHYPTPSSFHSCSNHWEGTCSSTAGTHSKDSRLCKYLSIYSSWNKLMTISFGQNFYF